MTRVFAIGVALGLLLSGAAWAGDLDGTWAGGWEQGDGVQIIVAGGKVIGFYRGDDYLTVERSTMVPGGGAIDFAWKTGEAVLRREADGKMRALIHDKGKTEQAIAVKRD